VFCTRNKKFKTFLQWPSMATPTLRSKTSIAVTSQVVEEFHGVQGEYDLDCWGEFEGDFGETPAAATATAQTTPPPTVKCNGVG
jgi:hypothetical protein